MLCSLRYDIYVRTVAWELRYAVNSHLFAAIFLPGRPSIRKDSLKHASQLCNVLLTPIRQLTLYPFADNF